MKQKHSQAEDEEGNRGIGDMGTYMIGTDSIQLLDLDSASRCRGSCLQCSCCILSQLIRRSDGDRVALWV